MVNDRPASNEHEGGVRRAGPTSARWTHVALPCHDVERSLAWYARFTPLVLLDRREDSEGSSAWLGHSDQVDHPFVLVLVSFSRDQSQGAQATLAPFAHLGIEVPSRAEVDRIAALGAADGCLAWPPSDLPDPIGYVCAVTDPDGNMIEISHNQGIYDKAREVWGSGSGS